MFEKEDYEWCNVNEDEKDEILSIGGFEGLSKVFVICAKDIKEEVYSFFHKTFIAEFKKEIPKAVCRALEVDDVDELDDDYRGYWEDCNPDDKVDENGRKRIKLKGSEDYEDEDYWTDDPCGKMIETDNGFEVKFGELCRIEPYGDYPSEIPVFNTVEAINKTIKKVKKNYLDVEIKARILSYGDNDQVIVGYDF